jgi:diguanylate cyclase (GGDEF)-like protein/PAS domain S-box-containing protein
MSKSESVQQAGVESEQQTQSEIAHAALRQREGRFRQFFEKNSSMMLLISPESGRIIDANEQAAAFYGYPRQDLLTLSIQDINTLTPEQVAGERLRALGEERNYFQFTHRLADGALREVEVYSTPIANEEHVELLSIIHDVTRRKQTDLRLAESEMRLRALVQTIPDLIWLKNTEGVYLLCNTRFEAFFGAQESDIVGKTDYDFVERLLADSFRASDQMAINRGEPCTNEEWVSFGSDGHRELLETTKTPLLNDQNQVVGVLGIGHNITARNAAANKIAHLAFYDSLTDLPNRRLMLDRLGQALASSTRHGRHGALMLIDLDNFKLLNDTLGHATGDQLLEEVAVRLRSGMRDGDTVARMGGDEFVVLLEDLDAHDLAAIQAEHVAAKILLSLAEPYTLSLSEGATGSSLRTHQCTSSIGIALFHDQSISAQELLKRADTAMYQAKAAGRNTLRFFDPEMQVVVAQRAAMEVDMRSAIAAQQFVLHYQPQVNAAGNVTGAEALVRWQHPLRGLVAPAEFIGLAEDTGLILPLGHWVLETACAQLAQWSTQKQMAHLTLAVNVSARQLAQTYFVDQVLAAVDHYKVPPGRLKLEITESLLLDKTEDTIHKMTTLKAHGIGFSLDDFGTGYSSLSYLKRLPLDQLKIDQSFVRDILSDTNDAAIARTVIALGRSLGLEVIAEGVESQEQRDYLHGIECHSYQGYWFSLPVALAEFEAFVHTQT